MASINFEQLEKSGSGYLGIGDTLPENTGGNTQAGGDDEVSIWPFFLEALEEQAKRLGVNLKDVGGTIGKGLIGAGKAAGKGARNIADWIIKFYTTGKTGLENIKGPDLKVLKQLKDVYAKSMYLYPYELATGALHKDIQRGTFSEIAGEILHKLNDAKFRGIISKDEQKQLAKVVKHFMDIAQKTGKYEQAAKALTAFRGTVNQTLAKAEKLMQQKQQLQKRMTQLRKEDKPYGEIFKSKLLESLKQRAKELYGKTTAGLKRFYHGLGATPQERMITAGGLGIVGILAASLLLDKLRRKEEEED